MHWEIDLDEEERRDLNRNVPGPDQEQEDDSDPATDDEDDEAYKGDQIQPLKGMRFNKKVRQEGQEDQPPVKYVVPSRREDWAHCMIS